MKRQNYGGRRQFNGEKDDKRPFYVDKLTAICGQINGERRQVLKFVIF
jgi:hypothetical protein